jgi:hypothetical protein
MSASPTQDKQAWLAVDRSGEHGIIRVFLSLMLDVDAVPENACERLPKAGWPARVPRDIHDDCSHESIRQRVTPNCGVCDSSVPESPPGAAPLWLGVVPREAFIGQHLA